MSDINIEDGSRATYKNLMKIVSKATHHIWVLEDTAQTKITDFMDV